LSWLRGGTAPADDRTFGRPGVCRGTDDQTARVGARKNPGTRPTKRLARQPEQASAGSKVRPGPRAPDPTSYPPPPRGYRTRTTTSILPGAYGRLLYLGIAG